MMPGSPVPSLIRSPLANDQDARHAGGARELGMLVQVQRLAMDR